MVRLQPLSAKTAGTNLSLSQFHYGSITTLFEVYVENVSLGVSIPLWFDYNSRLSFFKLNLKVVSIPLWFDYNYLFLNLIKLEDVVSIPLWFDYNWKRHRPLGRCRFQSQFHYGSITTEDNFQIECPICKVSIPLWFDYNHQHTTL